MRSAQELWGFRFGKREGPTWGPMIHKVHGAVLGPAARSEQSSSPHQFRGVYESCWSCDTSIKSTGPCYAPVPWSL